MEFNDIVKSFENKSILVTGSTGFLAKHMNVQTVLHMVGGQGDTSYAMNSHLQEMVISKAKTIVQHTVMDLYIKTLPKCFTIADLGCSSGPNSLRVISEIMDTIFSTSQKIGHKTPEIQVFLNDLHGNDFNTIFKSMPCFIEKFKKDKGDELARFFISGMPGSFFGRLFPTESLDLVHSSYSLHFLSQVPLGIENNKGNIYIANTSPSSVPKAYLTQYRKDFTLFLYSRSQEIVQGGRMVITQIGRRSTDPTSKECCDLWDLLTLSLLDMVYEGRMEEGKLDSFNWPAYFPCLEEVQSIIEEEGSFHVDLLESFDVSWEQNTNDLNEDNVYTTGQYMSKIIRAVAEPLLVNHFGEEIIDDLFLKFTEHVNVHIVNEKSQFINLVMCMTRKG